MNLATKEPANNQFEARAASSRDTSEDGEGIEKSKEKALDLYQKVADGGGAQRMIAFDLALELGKRGVDFGMATAASRY